MTDIAVIILQKNEALHIRRCLERLAPLEPRQIFVVDCFSTDGSDRIAAEMGASVVQHAWPGLYAPQYNWAMENCPIEAEWILRLDADEYLLPETIAEIREKLPRLGSDVSGIVFKRRHVVGWLNDTWAKHGFYPVRLLRLYRRTKGTCEARAMDEHIVLSKGRAVEFDGDFVDHNLNSFEWWREKHRGYAKREARDAVELFANPERMAHPSPTDRKKIKYYRLPRYFRAFAYFCLRYFLKGGFLDGRAGFRWHFWQGLWYRCLVDREIARLDHDGSAVGF